MTTFILLLVSTLETKAQISYFGRIESGYQHYVFRPVRVDPVHGWKGYNLDEKQNGFSVTFVNGLSFADRKLFTGIGLGYLNFEGINGVSVFGDFEYLPLKNKLTPLFNLKLGYNHIWNQYEGGTGTMHTEFGLGLNYTLKEKFGIYIKSGILITQQSLLIPITLGFRY
ncbi:MAG: hypothetical protein KF900_09180 [Bacteroidetes bacterium]|nr:hypothetical protein [Bacteroidota bacterium]